MTEEVKDYFREENYDAGVKIVASNINQILIGSKTIEDFEPGIFAERSAGNRFWDFIQTFLLPIVIALAGIYFISEGPVTKLYIYWKARKQFAAELGKDLKKANPKFQRYSVRKIIHSKEPEVMDAREKIVKRYKRLKKKKPLYYHFYYAFGTLTLMGFLSKKKKEMQQYSVYYHHKDLWNKGSSGEHDRDSYGGGGSDSFGGGSSGGGGASSDL